MESSSNTLQHPSRRIKGPVRPQNDLSPTFLAAVVVLAGLNLLFPASIQAGGQSPAVARGKKVFESKPCATCHFTTDMRKVGPGLKGLVGRQSKDGVGRLTVGRIKAFIKDPRRIKKNAQMIKVPMTNRELNDLMAYLKTL